jgi:hypothetical protein
MHSISSKKIRVLRRPVEPAANNGHSILAARLAYTLIETAKLNGVDPQALLTRNDEVVRTSG